MVQSLNAKSIETFCGLKLKSMISLQALTVCWIIPATRRAIRTLFWFTVLTIVKFHNQTFEGDRRVFENIFFEQFWRVIWMTLTYSIWSLGSKFSLHKKNCLLDNWMSMAQMTGIKWIYSIVWHKSHYTIAHCINRTLTLLCLSFSEQTL